MTAAPNAWAWSLAAVPSFTRERGRYWVPGAPRSRDDIDDIKVELIIGGEWAGQTSIAERREVITRLSRRYDPNTGAPYSVSYIAALLGMPPRSVCRIRRELGLAGMSSAERAALTRPGPGRYLARLARRYESRAADNRPRPGRGEPPGDREVAYIDARTSLADVRIARAAHEGLPLDAVDRCGYRTPQFQVATAKPSRRWLTTGG